MSAYWQIDKEWLRTEYLDKGRSTKDIAEKIKCSRDTVVNRLHEHSIPVCKIQPQRYRIGRDWLQVEYFDKRRSTASVAQEIGCSTPVILERLREYDIPIRGPNAAKELTANNYYMLAEKHGFRWIGSSLPTNSRAKTQWQCDQDHRWKVSYNAIQQGHGCPICYILWNRGENHPRWRGGKTKVVCDWCSKELERHPSAIKGNLRQFCSRQCRGKWQSENVTGENHPLWQGGTSFEPYGPGFNDKLKLTIRERDSFSCQLCGELENGKAHPCHHIDYDKNNNNPSNLITLCVSCHGKTGGGDRDAWQLNFSAITFARYSQGNIKWIAQECI